MDATVATGAASMMAIRVLLDHDVPEENIMLCSLLMAESGMQNINNHKLKNTFINALKRNSFGIELNSFIYLNKRRYQIEYIKYCILGFLF